MSSHALELTVAAAESLYLELVKLYHGAAIDFELLIGLSLSNQDTLVFHFIMTLRL